MNSIRLEQIVLLLALYMLAIAGKSAQNAQWELTVTDAVLLYLQQNPRPNAATPLAKAEFADRVRTGTHRVKRAFYAVLYAQYLSGEQQGGGQYLDDWIGIVSKRVEVGAVSASELEKLKIERAQLSDAASQAQLQLRLAMLTLQSDLGARATAWEVSGTWQIRLPALDFSTLLQTAYAERPDLQAALLRQASAAEVTALRTRIAAEVEAAVATLETYRTLPTRLQLNQLPRVVDVLGTEDTKYYEKLSSLAPLLEAVRMRRAERERWIRAQYQLQISLFDLEAAIGKALVP